MLKMKKIVAAIVFCGLLVAPLASVSAGQDGPWFDMENCKMCKGMAAEKGLMENTQWESHAIENGLITVCTVNKGFEEAYARAQKAMHETGDLLMKGEKMDLCGFCQSYSSLMMSGAKMEEVESNAAHLTLMTSNDADVVKKIHAHLERTNAEMAQMMKAMEEMKSKDPHAGHSHD